MDLFGAFIGVHVAGFSTDKSFVGLNLAGHFVDRPIVHRVSDSMVHEPRCSLRDLQGAGNLVGRNAIFAVGDQPHSAHPLVERNGAVLKDGSDLDGELLPAPKARPHQTRSEKREPRSCTTRARWPLRSPLRTFHSFKADSRVREVLNRGHQAFGNVYVNAVHKPIMSLNNV